MMKNDSHPSRDGDRRAVPAAPEVPHPIAERARRLAEAFTAPRQSLEERMAAGKAIRERVPRASHAAFERPAGVDPLAILAEQEKTRLTELVPVRHTRMLQSPFAFLRGSAAVMAADLAPAPTTGLRVQACGDMHVANFGVFASAERQLVFAINDFDETQPGPWEWDVKRLVASAFVASQYLGGSGAEREEAVRAASSSYRQRLRRYAEMGELEIWYDTISSHRLLDSLPPALRPAAEAVFGKARKRNHMQVLGKMTDLVDDRHRIVEQRPFVVRETHSSAGRPIQEAVGLALAAYLDSLAPERRQLLARYRIVDVAKKVVGVGSVGTRCWVALMQGRDEDDPVFLQLKEAQTSVLAAHLPAEDGARGPANHGARVVLGQRLIQGSPDIFLGWGEVDGMQIGRAHV